jgi:hypothetical protein
MTVHVCITHTQNTSLPLISETHNIYPIVLSLPLSWLLKMSRSTTVFEVIEEQKKLSRQVMGYSYNVLYTLVR